MLASFFKRLGAAGVDILYPPRCPLCDVFVPKDAIPCSDCEATLRRLESEATLPALDRCFLDRVLSCFAYEGRVQEAVHAFKFGGRIDLARFFAEALVRRVDACRPFDAVLAVPTVRARRFRRGFNPPALLAHRVARACGILNIVRALERRGGTKPQTGLERSARLANVCGSLFVRDRWRTALDDRRLLLIDDVLTTGVTANECARVLKRAGAREVTALTIARVL